MEINEYEVHEFGGKEYGVSTAHHSVGKIESAIIRLALRLTVRGRLLSRYRVMWLAEDGMSLEDTYSARERRRKEALTLARRVNEQASDEEIRAEISRLHQQQRDTQKAEFFESVRDWFCTVDWGSVMIAAAMFVCYTVLYYSLYYLFTKC